MDVFSVQTFGERLRQRRREQGLTQQALAQQLAVAQGWLSELENARQGTVEANTIYRLCQVLGCTSDYLLGLADHPERPARRRPRQPPADADTEEAA